MAQGLIGHEANVGGQTIDDLAFRRFRDAIPNTSRCYEAVMKAGEDFDYAGGGTTSYHAGLFDFNADIGSPCLSFIFQTDQDVQIEFNGNDESVMTIKAEEVFSLSRWELALFRVNVKALSSDANVRIFVSAYVTPTWTRQVQSQ